jgi:hypothetical protein
LLLGALGVKSYLDFSNRIDSAQHIVTQKLDEAQKKIASVQRDADTAFEEYKRLKARFDIASHIAEEVEALTKKVNSIEEKVGFTPSSTLPPEIKGQLESSFYQFQTYLRNLGYQPPDGQVEIDVPEKIMPGTVVFYDEKRHRMVINSEYVSNPSVLYHGYMIHVLYSKGGIPNDPGSKLWAYYAIASGLATYFSCSFNNNPQSMDGSGTLANKRRFNELKPDVSSAMSDGPEIWGGAFWDIRQRLDQSLADRLLFKAWFLFRPDEARTDRGAKFVKKLLEMDQALGDGKHREQLRSIFEVRGLTLGKLSAGSS